MRSIRAFLAGVAILIVILTGAAAFLVVYQVDAFGRAQNERQLLDTARAFSLVVDAKLQSYRGLLSALQGSTAAVSQNWRQLDQRSREVLRERDAWIVVVDRSGRQEINTRTSARPAPTSPSVADLWRRIDAGEGDVCNLKQAFGERNVLCVAAPIRKDGRTDQAIAVVFTPTLLDRTLSRDTIREGHIVALLDRNGIVIWRNIAPERFVGRAATPDLRAAMGENREGVMTSVSLEGVPTLVAFSRSRISGWTVVVAVPQREIVGPRQHALGLGLAAAAGLVLAAAALGLLAGGRLSRAVGHLSEAATRYRSGAAPAYTPSGFREIDTIGAALAAALEERKDNHERLLLAQEVGGIGTWEWDIRRDQGEVSEAYLEMHGLKGTSGPLKLRQVLDVIHPDDLAPYKARLAAAMTTKAPSTNDYRVVHPGGSVRWIYTKGRPVFALDGSLASAIGVVVDVTERKAAEEQLRLLMGEVNHRANNLLSVVQSAVSLSRAAHDEDLRQVILGRIQALANAHQLLAGSRWAGADLRLLIEVEASPYNLGDAAKIELDGDSIPISPPAAQGMALAIHELATNAAKYGALSTVEGRVSVRWRVEQDWLVLRWTETGGPPVTPPTRKGFGTAVIQRALQGSVGGTSEVEWRLEGVVCMLRLPLRPDSGFDDDPAP
jgi:PAS domain S-box-containing protein